MMDREPTLFDLPPAEAPLEVHGSAIISRCEKHRRELRRWWGNGPYVAWLMLNPSTADATKNDPTVNRCIQFTRRWGFNGLVIVNLYSYRTSKPTELWKPIDWQSNGPDWYMRDQLHENITWIEKVGRGAGMRIAAFGAEVMGRDQIWADHCLEAFGQPADDGGGTGIYCLGRSGNGGPLHPMARGRLRVPDATKPVPYVL